MAYTLHWPNNTEIQKVQAIHEYTQLAFAEEIGSISPVISIQADVLYPNVMASLSIGSNSRDEVVALGCKGHQIDNEFNLEPVVPIALPLVQYPTNTRGLNLNEVDMCARPVVNWERYIKSFSSFTIFRQKYWKRLSRSESQKQKHPIKYNEKRLERRKVKQKLKAQRILKEREKIITKRHIKRSKGRPELDIQDEESDSSWAEENDLEDSEDESHTDNSDNESECDTADEEVEEPNCNSTKVPSSENDFDTRLTKFSIQQVMKEIEPRMQRNSDLKKELFQIKPKLGAGVGWRRETCDNPNNEDLIVHDPKFFKKKQEFYIKDWRNKNEFPIASLRKYKNQPQLQIQGTWNNLYGGNSGACEWIYSKGNSGNIQVLVGCGSQLRVVNLESSEKKSLLSYAVSSVWEEEKSSVLTNARPGEKLKPHDDLIFQIKGCKNYGKAAVRRGKSVEMYDLSGTPTLISSISNICYGTKEYSANFHPGKAHNINPLLIAMDVNPFYQTEVLTLDENLVIRYVDVVKECTIGSEMGTIRETRLLHSPKYPTFESVNDFAGCTYAYNGNNLYYWQDSTVQFVDRRTSSPDMGIYNWSTLLDLRRDTSSISWSDQSRFKPKGLLTLTEMMSCVQPSKNPMYYYVGTTSRLFLMDLRVPKNPVIKMSHGMKSAATYIDSFTNENFEMVVAGSQKTNELFCASFDYTHSSCIERPGCKARNPILTSYPKHLSNSIEFFEEVSNDGFTLGFQPDHIKAKDHCSAWTTGISLFRMLNQNKFDQPPNIAVFTANNYGDLFYQEWQQKTDPIKEKIELGDERLRSSLEKWKSSFKSNPIDNLKPSSNNFSPIDCSLIIEPSSLTIQKKREGKTRTEYEWKADPIVFQRIKDHQMPLEDQINEISKFKGPKVKKLLRVWRQPYSKYEVLDNRDMIDSSEEDEGNKEQNHKVQDGDRQENEISLIDENIEDVDIKIEIPSGDEDDAQDPFDYLAFMQDDEVDEENEFNQRELPDDQEEENEYEESEPNLPDDDQDEEYEIENEYFEGQSDLLNEAQKEEIEIEYEEREPDLTNEDQEEVIELEYEEVKPLRKHKKHSSTKHVIDKSSPTSNPAPLIDPKTVKKSKSSSLKTVKKSKTPSSKTDKKLKAPSLSEPEQPIIEVKDSTIKSQTMPSLVLVRPEQSPIKSQTMPSIVRPEQPPNSTTTLPSLARPTPPFLSTGPTKLPPITITPKVPSLNGPTEPQIQAQQPSYNLLPFQQQPVIGSLNNSNPQQSFFVISGQSSDQGLLTQPIMSIPNFNMGNAGLFQLGGQIFQMPSNFIIQPQEVPMQQQEPIQEIIQIPNQSLIQPTLEPQMNDDVDELTIVRQMDKVSRWKPRKGMETASGQTSSNANGLEEAKKEKKKRVRKKLPSTKCKAPKSKMLTKPPPLKSDLLDAVSNENEQVKSRLNKLVAIQPRPEVEQVKVKPKPVQSTVQIILPPSGGPVEDIQIETGIVNQNHPFQDQELAMQNFQIQSLLNGQTHSVSSEKTKFSRYDDLTELQPMSTTINMTELRTIFNPFERNQPGF